MKSFITFGPGESFFSFVVAAAKNKLDRFSTSHYQPRRDDEPLSNLWPENTIVNYASSVIIKWRSKLRHQFSSPKFANSINKYINIYISKSYCVKISLKIFWLFLAQFFGSFQKIIIFLRYTSGSIFTIIAPYFLRKLIISPISQSAYGSWLQKLGKNKSSWTHE